MVYWVPFGLICRASRRCLRMKSTALITRRKEDRQLFSYSMLTDQKTALVAVNCSSVPYIRGFVQSHVAATGGLWSHLWLSCALQVEPCGALCGFPVAFSPPKCKAHKSHGAKPRGFAQIVYCTNLSWKFSYWAYNWISVCGHRVSMLQISGIRILGRYEGCIWVTRRLELGEGLAQ